MAEGALKVKTKEQLLRPASNHSAAGATEADPDRFGGGERARNPTVAHQAMTDTTPAAGTAEPEAAQSPPLAHDLRRVGEGVGGHRHRAAATLRLQSAIGNRETGKLAPGETERRELE